MSSHVCLPISGGKSAVTGASAGCGLFVQVLKKNAMGVS